MGSLFKLETGGDGGYFPNNELSGTMPSELGLSSSMAKDLSVSGNQMAGLIPTGETSASMQMQRSSAPYSQSPTCDAS